MRWRAAAVRQNPPQNSIIPAMTPDSDINLSGLRCPLPVLRTKKALSEMSPGQLLRIFATDPDSERDIPAFAKMAGHQLVQTESAPDGFIFFIRKK